MEGENHSIPHVIHYCWFGRGKKPEMATRCIASWRKFLPDYEIREWNEDNFDVSAIPYTQEAYAAKKYAFVSDYARFDILYRHGGVYFDTDVEIIRPMGDILAAGPYMGQETLVRKGRGVAVNAGLGFATEPGNLIMKEIVESYSHDHFRMEGDNDFGMKNVVTYATEVLLRHGLRTTPELQVVEGIRIYPVDYFNPKHTDRRLKITANTRTIHHYTASWHTMRSRIVHVCAYKYGIWAGRLLGLVWRNPLTIPGRIWKFLRSGK